MIDAKARPLTNGETNITVSALGMYLAEGRAGRIYGWDDDTERLVLSARAAISPVPFASPAQDDALTYDREAVGRIGADGADAAAFATSKGDE